MEYLKFLRARQRGQAAPRQPRQSSTTLIEEWADLEWKRRWQKTARGRKAMTWKTPWKKGTLELYSGLPKHQATALFLLRTEVIGLNAWLASIRVPGIRSECGCGWRAQTPCRPSGTCARDVPQIQQREGSTRTNVGKRNKDEAVGNVRECAEGGKMVCQAGYPAAIQHGEGG